MIVQKSSNPSADRVAKNDFKLILAAAFMIVSIACIGMAICSEDADAAVDDTFVDGNEQGI